MRRLSYADLQRMSDRELEAFSKAAVEGARHAPAPVPGGPLKLDVRALVRQSRAERTHFAAAADWESDGRRIREGLVGARRRSLPWRLTEGERQWRRARSAAEMRATGAETLFDLKYGHPPRLRTYLGEVAEAGRLQVPPAALRDLPGYRWAPAFSREFPGVIRIGEAAAPVMRRLAPAAHVVSRVAAPIGLALDIYEIARTSGMAVSWLRAEAEAHESGMQAARMLQRRAEQLEAQQERRQAAAIAERMPYVEEWIREHASPDPELVALSRAPWEGRPWAGDLAGAVFHPERSWAAGPAARGVGGYAPGLLDFRRERPEELRERGAVEEALAIAPWAESREDVLKEIARGLQELGLLDRPQDAHR